MMAIKILNSQGTKIYVLPDSVDVSDCTKVKTAMASTGADAPKLVGCPQSLGDISETRTSTEYKCLSSNESVKALGAISRGSLEIGLLLDPDDTEGQKALKDAFANNTPVYVVIELPNPATASSGHGTYYIFKASVSAVTTGIAMDAAISYTATLEISSSISECPAE
jgi:hypothetical protein